MGSFYPGNDTDKEAFLDQTSKPSGAPSFSTIEKTVLGAPSDSSVDDDSDSDEPDVIAPRSRLPASPPDAVPGGAGPATPTPSLPKGDALDLDPSKLMEEDKARRDSFGLQRLVASVADQFGAIPSVGDIALHRQPAQTHMVQDVDDAERAAGDPWDRRKKLLEAYQSANDYKDMQAMRDPDSATSKMMKLNLKSALGTLMKGARNNPASMESLQQMQTMLNDPKISGSQIQGMVEKNPLLKEQFSADLASQKADAQMAMWAPRLAAQTARTNSMQDRITLQASAAIDKDPILQKYDLQQGKVMRAGHILEKAMSGERKMTVERFNEVQQAIATAINEGGSHAATEQEATQFKSLQQKYLQLSGYLAGHQQDYNNPAVFKQLKSVVDDLNEAIEDNRAMRMKHVTPGRSFATPAAQQAEESKEQAYGRQPQTNAQSAPVPAPASSPAGQTRADKLKFLIGD